MAAKLLVGTAGWSYPDWNGAFYPPKKPRGFEPLAYYAQFFDVVEVDSTFYRPPSEKTACGWIEKVRANARFVFAAKLWRGFTHGDRNYGEGELSVFKRGLAPLADSGKLAALLWQFPWSFRFAPHNLDLLARLAKDFSDWPNFVEVRHSNWNQPKAIESLRQLGVGWVNIDQPQLRDCLPPTDIATNKRGYFRMHGRNKKNWFRDPSTPPLSPFDFQPSHLPIRRYDHLYSESELRALLPKIRKLALSTKDLLVIFNNHNRGQAAANALQFLALATDTKPAAPAPLIAAFPALENICLMTSVGDKTPQAEMF